MENCIDYAGMFPPSALPAAEAFDLFRMYQNGRDRWILGNLAWPIQELETLATLIQANPGETVGLTVIGRPLSQSELWEDSRVADANELNVFLDQIGELAVIEAYECPVPDSENINSYLAQLNGFRGAEVYIELPHDADFGSAIATFAEAEWPYAKLRAGGETVPSARTISLFLHECASLEVPFKLTAGLHRAIATVDEDGSVLAHGFLNVMYALGQILENDALPNEVERILCRHESVSWNLGQSLSLDGVSLSLETIEDIRSLFLCFGSCSVEDPLSDIQFLWKKD